MPPEPHGSLSSAHVPFPNILQSRPCNPCWRHKCLLYRRILYLRGGGGRLDSSHQPAVQPVVYCPLCTPPPPPCMSYLHFNYAAVEEASKLPCHTDQVASASLLWHGMRAPST